MEFRLIGHQLWQGDEAACENNGQIHLAHKDCHYIAHKQSHQNGKLLQITLCKAVPAKTDHKRNRPQQKILRRAKILCITAAKGSCTNRKQGHPDCNNNRCRNHRCNQLSPIFCQKPQCAFKKTADKHRPDNRGIPIIRRNRT